VKQILPWLIAAKTAGVVKGGSTTNLLDLDIRIIHKASKTLGSETGFQVKTGKTGSKSFTPYESL